VINTLNDLQYIAQRSMPFQILLGNLLATFLILRQPFVREELFATFRKAYTFWVTFGLFFLTKMLNDPLF